MERSGHGRELDGDGQGWVGETQVDRSERAPAQRDNGPGGGGPEFLPTSGSFGAPSPTPTHPNPEPRSPPQSLRDPQLGQSSSEDSDSEDSVAVDDGQDQADRADLRDRLAEARFTARGRPISRLERTAMAVAAYASWRVLRKARRAAVESVSRFQFTTKPRPQPDSPGLETPAQGVTRLFLGHEDLLEEPGPPTAPPEPEPEAEGPDGSQPPPLPRTTAWWHEEKERQRAHPFRAGKVAEASLNFRPGLRPVPPPGSYYLWGPQLRTSVLSPEDGLAVRKILAKDIRAGGCEACDWSEVDVVMPVHLVRHPVTKKPRLTHDSRAVNVRLCDSTADMARAEDALLRGAVAGKLDLLMAFRHVSFSEADRRVMGFTVDGVLFRWNALTFGCSQSPELFANALARTLRTFHLPGGAAVIVYVDDILVVAPDAASLDNAMEHLCRNLSDQGWYIALDKTFAYAMSKAPFLGLLVDLVASKLRVTRAKARRVRELCEVAIGRRRVTLRDLQRIGGLLAFLSKAAPEAGLCRHGINAATAEAEKLPGRTVSVRGQLADDLRFWCETAESLPELSHVDANGPTMDVATDAAGLPALGFGGLVWPGAAPAPDIDAALGEVANFAANPRQGTAVATGAEVYAGPLPTSMASASSSALEVRALIAVLVGYAGKHGPSALRGRVVKWYSDSAVAVGSVSRWRAKAAGLMREVLALLRLVRKLGCRLVPHWVSREAGWQPVADALSKVQWRRDSAEWHFTRSDAQAVCAEVTGGKWSVPAHDLFASKGNAVCDSFSSQWPEFGNSWTDAFARSWSGVRKGWAFPPFSAAGAALRAACASGLDVVIIIPRETAVPARLRGAHRVELKPPHLVDASGHRPPQPCPIPLDAIHVSNG